MNGRSFSMQHFFFGSSNAQYKTNMNTNGIWLKFQIASHWILTEKRKMIVDELVRWSNGGWNCSERNKFDSAKESNSSKNRIYILNAINLAVSIHSMIEMNVIPNFADEAQMVSVAAWRCLRVMKWIRFNWSNVQNAFIKKMNSFICSMCSLLRR